MSSGTSLRVGNASGFYGDRFSAMREMLTGGKLDVLTGDYLAELTMLILGRDRLKDPNLGYARTFLRQMKECMSIALGEGVKIVSNAGGLNPASLAGELRALNPDAKIAYVTGDDLLERYPDQITANAYLGAWGIAECLRAGADIVVTGRVTDASLVVGPAAAHFGWQRNDFDALAGAVVAGHVLECGAQATGGNYSFFNTLDLSKPLGFPIAELRDDGSCVITKHLGTGGAVTVGTVTAQLLYEIDAPRYQGPDVVARFDTIELAQEGADRVRISGVRGEAPPTTVKVCLNRLGGFRNQVEFVLTGLDSDAKEALIRSQLSGVTGAIWTRHGDLLRCTVKDSSPEAVGRAFSSKAIELALASYPGFHVTAPPGDAQPYGVYTAAYLPATEVPHLAVLHTGEERSIAPTPGSATTLAEPVAAPGPAAAPGADTARRPLGVIAGARSGDKGGDANVGVWAQTDEAYRWLAETLTVARLRELLPEVQQAQRYELPNLRALNFVCRGLLGEGVSSSTRFDPQAKALGEQLRAVEVDIPVELL
ncbi:exopolyphosphatase [Rhizocola hellebori]|uniref:Exopolyphosphatase n=1 Tax=Rhizocola hellebori TaxID=1392758 RepID=A0A8J3QDC3_9ACTN|nr:acyclic terpene utilization AtuA family protein [Rhizocola hellebori]GIH08669.1 exopolyphosphatase [Rhizocola hellebori]